jgi:methylglutaconyl-CoA hydratase
MLVQQRYENTLCEITLNRPEKHNAFNSELIQQLSAILMQLKSRQDIKVVIIQANGKHFSAGADLQWMQASKDYNAQENYTDAMQLASMLEALYRLPQTTIASVHGKALGGALGIISCCDIAIAANDSAFCFSEVKLGLIPAVISPYILQAIGARQAQRYCLSAEWFNAERAKHLGLLHETVPATQLAEYTQQLVQQIKQNAPVALSTCKTFLREVASMPLDSNLITHTAKTIAALRCSEEAQEGIQAFFDKRQPQWITDV